jgi:hypothetical protein
MDSFTIDNLLKPVSNFIGVYARDELSSLTLGFDEGLIINTDKRDEPGEHWVAIYKENDGFCEYFDPYGLPPLQDEFYNFLSTNSKVGFGYNANQLQCVECVTCGHYCIEYIIQKCVETKSLCEIVNSFTKNPLINDIIVKQRINKLYSK